MAVRPLFHQSGQLFRSCCMNGIEWAWATDVQDIACWRYVLRMLEQFACA